VPLRLDDFKFTFFQQPYGWPGEKITTDMPMMVNIRQDPFEAHAVSSRREFEPFGRWIHERLFRQRVLAVRDGPAVRRTIGANRRSSFRRMQAPASFNLEAVKAKVEEMIKNRPGQ
jgi:arylsulfatase